MGLKSNVIAILCATLCVSVNCLMFHLPVNSKKCLKEEIHKDVLVTGIYDVSEISGSQKVDLKVRH